MKYLTRKAILPLAFSVFWLSLGSLINFHQHHLYGKFLLTESIIGKPKKKVQDDVIKVFHQTFNDLTSDQACIAAGNDTKIRVFRALMSLIIDHQHTGSPADYTTFPSLRAPPAA